MSRRTGILGLVLWALAGCVNPQTRMQMADDVEMKRDLSVKTVGDIADVRSVGPVQVSGFGLVTGLAGTGGTPQGPYRDELTKILRKQKIEHVKEILDSPNNAMVLVTGFIPPGARQGEKIDVEVTLPPGSKATSVAGGYLQTCALRNHDSTKGLLPEYKGGDHSIAGHILARARGPVMVSLGEGVMPIEQKRGRVWRGGASLIDLPYVLVLKKDDKSARVAYGVAERINSLFQDDAARLQRLSQQAKQLYLLDDVAKHMNHPFEQREAGRIAKVKNKEMVEVRVPFTYRLNPDRYLYVTHLVPLAEDPEHLGRYRRRLQKLLADPAETVMAARRLEALGRDSVVSLRGGLLHEHPLVRFASAEALAYLGDSSGTDALGTLAIEHPLLAGGCVQALASLDEPAGRQRLLTMTADANVELRMAAFAALRQLAELDLPEPNLRTPAGEPFREFLNKQLGGEHLAGSFWLHHVAPKSERLVAFAADTRAEVVLFGDNIVLTAPVRMVAGQEFTMTYEPGGDRFAVSRFSPRLGKRQKLCPPTLDDIIHAMAELGADYPDVIDLIRRLDDKECLNAKVRLAAPAPEVTPQMLAEWGREHRQMRDSTSEAERPGLVGTEPAAH